MATNPCCAECGKEEEGGIVSLKTCKSCMLVKYCSAACQKNNWSKHKIECKRRAAELHDVALFKEPPEKEECPICFLPMLQRLLSSVTLPPATILSVPIYNFVNANEELKGKAMAQYYTCCGKSICGGCVYSVALSGNTETCPFCKAKTSGKTAEEEKEELLERVKVNDAGAIYQLGICYYHGKLGLLQDREKANELWTQAARLGSSQAHYTLGNNYYEVGDLKKARFHLGAAAMAGHETARDDLGYIEIKSNKKELAVRHWMIAASAGSYNAMHNLLLAFEDGVVSRELIDSMLTAYNNSCAEVRSKARDAYIKMCIDLIGEK